ncbi:MAG: hypothetical protein ACREX4_23445 [Gammaproteobacteria bacterium]
MFEIPGLKKPDALALDPAGIFWVYSRGTLYSYSFLRGMFIGDVGNTVA